MASDLENSGSGNPFEVSRVLRSQAFSTMPYASPHEFDLEGNLIVCGSHLILPQICVHTGVTGDLVEIQRYTVFPSMKLVIKQRSCYVIMYVTRSEQSRRARIAIVFRVIVIIGFILMAAPMLLQQSQTVILFPVGLLMTGMSSFLHYRHNLPLVLVKYISPGIYKLRGFSKAFLTQLAMHKVERVGRSSSVNRHESTSEFEV